MGQGDRTAGLGRSAVQLRQELLRLLETHGILRFLEMRPNTAPRTTTWIVEVSGERLELENSPRSRAADEYVRGLLIGLASRIPHVGDDGLAVAAARFADSRPWSCGLRDGLASQAAELPEVPRDRAVQILNLLPS